mmetsp:Transcript_75610/g.142588  ORF Transcript_75610/g.142588 Transcript_75610/m.142588 type:complete len:127 (-) Transcript_75610:3-383(-)
METKAAPDVNAQKKAFQACIKADCIKLAEKAEQLKSASQVALRFGLGAGGAGRQDPRSSEAAEQKEDTIRGLEACEQRCARNHWPAALKQPWIGKVALDMAGVAQDQTAGTRGANRFSWGQTMQGR